MSEQAVLRSPQVVTTELDISPATLRRWSEEFKNFLSGDANSSGGRSHRRYADGDMTTLIVVKELMSDGLTYEQVRQKLAGHSTVPVEPDDIVQGPAPEYENPPEAGPGDDFELPEKSDDTTLIAANGADSPAIAFLTNTLTTLSDSQKSILNSQAANRELLGVLLQDNFNLKEENNRLRERILEVERDVGQSRQEEEWRRDALRQELDAKIGAVSQMAAQAMDVAQSVEVPEIKAVESKSGCLGMLFGGGGTKFVTVPPRKKKILRTAPPLPATGQQPAVPPQGASASHPKPFFPPE